MWLIDTEKLCLKSSNELLRADMGGYQGSEPHSPPYAILSHRWVQGEVSFKQMNEYSRLDLENLHGWHKIKGFCELARALGYKWAWVDTCCIDKSSSAELSEAINSMFQWYREAELCCVYLYDVSSDDISQQLPKSEWFQRGWTLQELLAPRKMQSYSSTWTCIGSRRELWAEISSATGIPAIVLCNPDVRSIQRYSIAQRMSWASKRRTSRPEDMAYCLLGLFELNLPLLYGEGGKQAFRRLQLELINTYNDESIFAWNTSRWRDASVIAHSPADFGLLQDVTCGSSLVTSRAFSVTNRGLQLRSPLFIDTLSDFFIPLDCNRYGTPLGLYLIKYRGDVEEPFMRDGICEISDELTMYEPEQEIFLYADDRSVYTYDERRAAEHVRRDDTDGLEQQLRARLRNYVPSNADAILRMHEDLPPLFDFTRFKTVGLETLVKFGSKKSRDRKFVNYRSFCEMLRKSNLDQGWVSLFLERADKVFSNNVKSGRVTVGEKNI